MTLTNLGVECATDAHRLLLPWSMIAEVVKSNGDIYLCYARDGRIMIPAHAFENEDALAAFSAMATAQVEATRRERFSGWENQIVCRTAITGPDFAALRNLSARAFVSAREYRITEAIVWFSRITVTVFGLLPAAVGYYPSITGWALLTLAAGLGVGAWIRVWLRRPRIKAAEPQKFQDARLITLSTHGVETSTLKDSAVLRWDDVEKICADAPLIAFLSRKADSVIIPMSAFPNDDARDRFLQIATAYQRGETPPPAPVTWPPVPTG